MRAVENRVLLLYAGKELRSAVPTPAYCPYFGMWNSSTRTEKLLSSSLLTLWTYQTLVTVIHLLTIRLSYLVSSKLQWSSRAISSSPAHPSLLQGFHLDPILVCTSLGGIWRCYVLWKGVIQIFIAPHLSFDAALVWYINSRSIINTRKQAGGNLEALLEYR
jgi:hypothetical protein